MYNATDTSLELGGSSPTLPEFPSTTVTLHSPSSRRELPLMPPSPPLIPPPPPLTPPAMSRPCASWCANHPARVTFKCEHFSNCADCPECYVPSPPASPAESQPQPQPPLLPLAIPLPPASSQGLQAVVDELNYRFAHGNATNDWTRAGVLFHAFDAVDGYDGHDDLWNGCEHSSTWCFRLDRFSVSMLNSRIPHYFNQYKSHATGAPKGGFIVSTEVVGPDGVRCMMSHDGGTVGGGNGCSGPACRSCHISGRCGVWCHFAGGEQLQFMLQQHEATSEGRGQSCGQATCNYNEIVIDSAYWKSHLPHTIRAVFFPRGESQAQSMAQRVHSSFLRRYPDQAGTTPLISFAGNAVATPFRLECCL